MTLINFFGPLAQFDLAQRQLTCSYHVLRGILGSSVLDELLVFMTAILFLFQLFNFNNKTSQKGNVLNIGYENVIKNIIQSFKLNVTNCYMSINMHFKSLKLVIYNIIVNLKKIVIHLYLNILNIIKRLTSVYPKQRKLKPKPLVKKFPQKNIFIRSFSTQQNPKKPWIISIKNKISKYSRHFYLFVCNPYSVGYSWHVWLPFHCLILWLITFALCFYMCHDIMEIRFHDAVFAKVVCDNTWIFVIYYIILYLTVIWVIRSSLLNWFSFIIVANFILSFVISAHASFVRGADCLYNSIFLYFRQPFSTNAPAWPGFDTSDWWLIGTSISIVVTIFLRCYFRLLPAVWIHNAQPGIFKLNDHLLMKQGFKYVVEPLHPLPKEQAYGFIFLFCRVNDLNITHFFSVLHAWYPYTTNITDQQTAQFLIQHIGQQNFVHFVHYVTQYI